MSRTTEIIRRLHQSSSDEKGLSDPRNEATSLWPRFRKVREAITSTFGPKTPQGIKRESSTFNWSGFDEGIHDHSGHVEGKIAGITLDLKIKGTTVDDNPKYVIKEDGQWQLTHNREQNIEISGTFASPDGFIGTLQIHLENGQPHDEAYWLQTNDGTLRLEQVVNPERLVFDAEKLTLKNHTVTIPGTRVELQRFLQNVTRS